MRSEIYDVVVLGGGPAGAAAAIELARNKMKVAILERSHYAHKRIGDTVAQEASVWLRRLGVWEAFQQVPHLRSCGIVTQWGTSTPIETDVLFKPSGTGWHIDRSRFDAMMTDTAERAGAVVLRSAFPRACRNAGSGAWCVAVVIQGLQREFTSRWLLDATGRKRWLLHRLGVKRKCWDRLVALIGQIEHRVHNDARLFIEATAEGWWYYAPLPGGRGIAAYMTDSDLLARNSSKVGAFWERKRRCAPMIFELSEHAIIENSPQVVAANSAWSEMVAGPGWLAVGDAALAHDPLSGLGICHGLATGWNAARAVLAAYGGDGEAVERYQRWAQGGYESYRIEYASFYGRMARWPDAPFWKRRAAAVNASG